MGIAASAAVATLCFVHGIGGYTPDIADRIPKELAKRNVNFVAFDFGTGGSILEQNERLVAAFQKEIDKNPDFRCHLVGHSRGAINSRAVLAKGVVNVKQADGTVVKKPLSDFVSSYTSIAGPQRGTPAGKLAKLLMPWKKGLAQTRPEYILKTFNDPKSPHYSPLVVKSYFYKTQPDGSMKCHEGFFQKFGLGTLKALYPKSLGAGHGDSVIPTESQALGAESALAHLGDATDLGTLNICHSYFDHRYELNPSIIDFLTMHAYRVERRLPAFAYRADGNVNPVWDRLVAMGVAPTSGEKLTMDNYLTQRAQEIITIVPPEQFGPPAWHRDAIANDPNP